MDTHERSLTRTYNKALGQLRALPKGDPRRNSVIVKVLYWQGALERYQRSRNN